MDLTHFDTRDAADAGQIMHVAHPIKGHPLYVGEGAASDGSVAHYDKPVQPVTMTVRGYNAETVQEVFRRYNAIRAQAGGRDLTDAEAKRQGEDLIDALIVDWANITDAKGKPRPCDRQNKLAVVDSNASFWRQLDTFARDQSHFFEDGATT